MPIATVPEKLVDTAYHHTLRNQQLDLPEDRLDMLARELANSNGEFATIQITLQMSGLFDSAEHRLLLLAYELASVRTEVQAR